MSRTAGAPRPAEDAAASAQDAGVGGRRRLVIVADDLTGAADAAAPFAARGAEVSIALRWPPPDDVEVLVLVADSRWRAPAAAAGRVAELVAAGRAWGAERLFVKIDSTLRGNVLAEVTAALAAWAEGAPTVATPAFPAQGRTVREGVLHVHGVPQDVEVGARFPAGVRVRDAEDDAALLDLAQQAVREGAVAVGSAGLARALAQVLQPPGPDARRRPGLDTGVLVVVGSTSPVSRAQSAVLLEAGVSCLVVRPDRPSELAEPAEELASGRRVLVTTELVTSDSAEVAGDSAQAQAMAAELARVVRALVAAAPACALVVTGGSTALAVAEGLAAASLRLLAEVEAGVALGELQLPGRVVPAITKSGGFGPPEALLRAVELLEECA